MKSKILNALKTKYSNLGLSEKALDGVASFLEKTIADEKEIDAAIGEASVSSLLKVFQSEIDTERGKASKANRDLEDYKKNHPSQDPPLDNVADGETMKLLQELRADLEKQKSEIAAERKRMADKNIIENLRTELKTKHGCTSDYILKKTLTGIGVNDGDTMDSLVARYKTVYDAEYKEAYGNGAQAPFGNFFGNQPGDDPNEFSGAVARLQRSGVLKQNDK